MGSEERLALARLVEEDEDFVAALADVTSVDDLVRIAGEHGVQVDPDDVVAAEGELSDAELDAASGGSYAMLVRASVMGCA